MGPAHLASPLEVRPSWGPTCHIWVIGLVFSRFRCSGWPMDPCNRTWLVEKMFPWIDDVSPCLWLCFFSFVATKWVLLILVLGWAFYLGSFFLVSCIFCPNSPAHISRPTYVEFVNISSYPNIYSLSCSYFARKLTVKMGRNRPSTVSVRITKIRVKT